jgi:hypothetical protein
VTRTTWALAGTAILVAVGTIGAVVATSGSNQAAQAAQAEPPPNTATVQEGKLSATVSQNGTLTYQGQPDGSPYTVINQDQGTYTQLPALGQVITQGQVIYRVDDSPVVLLHGTVPAYRTLTAGSTGADVAELNSDLVTLGYATSAQLNPISDSFDSATTTALEKLQAALEITQNGILALGQAVFEPATLRITAISASWGGGAQGGQTALQATSTTRIVQVALDASQQTEVAVGNTVTITLPDNQTTPGVVSSVGAVATCPSSSSPGSNGSTSSSATLGTDTCSSANSGNATPTITVYVTPSDPAATGTWDQAPVQVGITTASVPNALAVPVTALLAQPGGGYSVEVVNTAGTDHLVAVSLGLFDDAQGLVQVTGPGLAAGQKVVVPST